MSAMTITEADIQEAIDRLDEDDPQRAMWQAQLDNVRKWSFRKASLIADGEWEEALTITGSEDRAAAMIALGERLDDAAVRAMLDEFWTMTEGWSGNPHLRAGMYGLLARATSSGPLIQDGGEHLARLVAAFVFRGNQGETPEGVCAWTLDYDKAVGFAKMPWTARGALLGMKKRENAVPTVWRATLHGTDVIAYFGDRGEQEAIADAAKMYDVEAVAWAEPA